MELGIEQIARKVTHEHSVAQASTRLGVKPTNYQKWSLPSNSWDPLAQSKTTPPRPYNPSWQSLRDRTSSRLSNRSSTTIPVAKIWFTISTLLEKCKPCTWRTPLLLIQQLYSFGLGRTPRRWKENIVSLVKSPLFPGEIAFVLPKLLMNPIAPLLHPGVSAHHDAVEQEEQREAMVPLHQCKV